MQQKLRNDLPMRRHKETKIHYLKSRFRELCYRLADWLHHSMIAIPALRKFPENREVRSAATIGQRPIRAQRRTNDENLGLEGSGAENTQAVPGVNVAGFMESEKGVGEAARATIRSLTAAKIPYTLGEITDPVSLRIGNSSRDFSNENPYPINLIHVNADLLPRFARRNRRFLTGRYNVGYWNWELSSFPRVWWDRLGYLDEVWLPSTFCIEAISRVSSIPVLRVPYSIDPAIRACDKRYRTNLELSSQTFVFLFYFDFHSFMERKNPIGLIRAFQKAFAAEEDAALVIKCSHAKRSALTLINQARNHHPKIKIYDAILSPGALNSLLSSCDVYVSLHRSEGFGLTLTEAMNLGKPVIATGYSSNLDFMNESNSFLVKYKLVELEKNHGPYKKGFQWAEPDIDHAAEVMRYVYHHRDRAATIGEQGRRDVRQLLHPNVIGGTIRARLAQIAQTQVSMGEGSGGSTAIPLC